MNTDVEFNLNSQNKWVNKIQTQEDYFAWIIYLNTVPIGFINLNNLNSEIKSASWGYYIGDENYLGLGGIIAPYFYNFVFNTLGLIQLNAQVFYNNLPVISMHLKFGYEFEPSMDCVIKKNNVSILLIGMKLINTNWNLKKYKNFQSNLKL
jgi:RimJ/RimL family protein N-acetyltransferase